MKMINSEEKLTNSSNMLKPSGNNEKPPVFAFGFRLRFAATPRQDAVARQTSNEHQATSNEHQATSNEQQTTSNKQPAKPVGAKRKSR